MWGNFYLVLLILIAANLGPVECNFLETLLSFVTGPQEPEKNMNVTEIIAFHGYPVVTHTVTTEDGYILNHHRIPYGKSGPSQRRQTVILQHGIMVSSSSWVWSTPDKNLPYLLADAGYDVWLTNVRGNEYCLKHTTLDSSSRAFWKFSWATIDYILNNTGEQKLLYVGLSMGTTIALAMLSSKPEYNEKIDGVFIMAPVATVTYVKGLLPTIASGLPIAVLQLLNHGELPFNYVFPNWFLDTVCSFPFTSRICVEVVFAVGGEDWAQVNQIRVSKRFAMFDFNFDNQKSYNQNSPPDYDLGKITAPVAIFWADNDWLATPKYVASLASKLKNLQLNYKIDHQGFTHGDFGFGNDIVRLVYKPLMESMKLLAPYISFTKLPCLPLILRCGDW